MLGGGLALSVGAEARETDADHAALGADSRSRLASGEVEAGPGLQIAEGSEPGVAQHRVEEEVMAAEFGHVPAEPAAAVFVACIAQAAPWQRHVEE
jgi:hypothetical protein